MKELEYILIFLSNILTGIAFIFSVYYLIIALFGIYRKKDLDDVNPEKRFALIVAAHNEEVVVKDIVVSLNNLDYPKELYDTFVIADNCTDNTAKRAMEAGALVHERFDDKKKGKGYALEWMFNRIFHMDKKYDAVCIFDADNLVSKNFLKEMNKKLCSGSKVIQGYLDSKNPMDTWITGSYSITFWANNRMAQLAKINMGISSQLGGTGCCMDTEILKKLGWGATCLTEDLEFTCKLVSNGYKVDFAYDAVVYDEKPLTLVQSWRQRKRWMQGFVDVSSRYFFNLMKLGIKKMSLTAIDCAIYTIQPLLFILFGLTTVIGVFKFILGSYEYVMNSYNKVVITTNASMGMTILTIFATFVGLVMLLYTPILLISEKKFNFKVLIYYIIMPIYIVTWLPICIQAIMDKDNKEWDHTIHSRSVDISDLEKTH